MNYMEKVAQMLGVNMGEKFYVVDETNLKVLVRMTERGIVDDGGAYRSEALRYLICGEYKVQKIPKQKHTGLETIEKGKPFYTLYGPREGFNICYEPNLIGDGFSDKTIRDNWERYIDVKKRLAKAASEINPVPIDWGNSNQPKYFIYCNRTAKEPLVDETNIYTDDICFTSKEGAKRAIKIVGKNDLLWMLRCFQPFIGYSTEAAKADRFSNVFSLFDRGGATGVSE